MNEEFRPSLDFVTRVMEQVHAYDQSKVSFLVWFVNHPSIRYALAGGGTLFGIFKAVPVF
ncbi:MAG: hypothetical protein HXX11_07875 [Desulfuromonadales bacterium]|nr:hypothetical protein [Desulfuromonadales bacterium]